MHHVTRASLGQELGAAASSTAGRVVVQGFPLLLRRKELVLSHHQACRAYGWYAYAYLTSCMSVVLAASASDTTARSSTLLRQVRPLPCVPAAASDAGGATLASGLAEKRGPSCSSSFMSSSIALGSLPCFSLSSACHLTTTPGTTTVSVRAHGNPTDVGGFEEI